MLQLEEEQVEQEEPDEERETEVPEIPNGDITRRMTLQSQVGQDNPDPFEPIDTNSSNLTPQLSQVNS